MADERELEKQLKLAAKTGNYIVGRREVLSGVKGSKLLVWSVSANVPQGILDEARTLAVPAVRFNGNPVELGRSCGIPFRVSVIALKSPGDADISSFSKSSDYSSSAVNTSFASPSASLTTVAAKATSAISIIHPTEGVEEETPPKKPRRKKAGEEAEGDDDGEKIKAKKGTDKSDKVENKKKKSKEKKDENKSSSKKKVAKKGAKKISADEKDEE